MCDLSSLRHITRNSREKYKKILLCFFIDKSRFILKHEEFAVTFFSVLKAGPYRAQSLTGPWSKWWNLEFSFWWAFARLSASNNQRVSYRLYCDGQPLTKTVHSLRLDRLCLIIRHETLLLRDQREEKKHKIWFSSFQRLSLGSLVAWLFFITLRFSLSNETQRAFKKLSRANKKEKEKNFSRVYCFLRRRYVREIEPYTIGRSMSERHSSASKRAYKKKKWTSASARWERAAENWRKNFAKVSYIVGAMAGPRSEREAKEWKNKNQ